MKLTNWVILISLVVLGVAVFIACGGSDEDAEDRSCETTFDCLGGQICNQSTQKCEFMSFCTSNDSCELGMYCKNQHCESATICEFSTECAAGFECSLDGYCLPEGSSDVPSGCTSDSECAYTEYCYLATGTCLLRDTNPDGDDPDGDDPDGDDPDGDDPVDPCDPNPCTELNKNRCTAAGSSFSCACNSGYVEESGVCVSDGPSDPCDPNPCDVPNQNVCQADGAGGWDCLCNSGYHMESGTCVEDSSGSMSRGMFCETIPGASLGYNFMCVYIGAIELKANAEACSPCADLPAGQATTIDLTDCSGNSLIGGPQALDAVSETEHYAYVLVPDGQSASLTIFTLDTSQVTCDQVTYQDILDNLGRKNGPVLIDEIPVFLD